MVFFSAAALLNMGASQGGSYSLAGVTAVVLVAAALLVPWPQRWWWAAPALTCVATGWWGWPLLPLLVIAVFDLASTRRVFQSIGCALGAMLVSSLSHAPVPLWVPQRYGAAAFLTLAVVAGLWMGGRRRLVAALNDQVSLLKVERQLREERARSEERSRIAAEMHDVLAHRLSLIALHTGVLTTRAHDLPPAVAERLVLLRASSTQALGELRDVLGALHEGPRTGSAGVERPAPGDVRELVDEAGQAGQQVELTVDGDDAQTSTAHRFAVHRVVQESLTNARKHAGSFPVEVRIDHTADGTRVTVTNGLPQSLHPDRVESGYGLIGLGERLRALGGRLDVGPDINGRWVVDAFIPHLQERRASELEGSRS